MFTSLSDTLYNFYNTAGVAYYIPFYQRQYSWDKEDVAKLMDDLYDGVRRICSNADYLRFIGTLILLKERQPAQNLHFDTNGLITEVKNVIDGQQRLCTLSILAILISEELKNIIKDIDSQGLENLSGILELKTTINNRLLELEELYSLQVRKTNVDPERKPIIIRAHDTNSNPVADQWTLKGDYEKFYRSDVSKFIAHYICKKEVFNDISNEKLINVICEIKAWLEKTRNGSDYPNAEDLLALSSSNGNMSGFMDGEIDLQYIKGVSKNGYDLVCGTIKILAMLRFLTHKTYVTCIECPSEDLAFDMFQSLNATGTPLTAIEVFKPLVVNTVGPIYGSSPTKKYFDKVDEFFNSNKTSALKEKNTDEILMRLSLTYSGDDLGRRFSEQRDFLKTEYENAASSSERESFVHCLSDLTEYWEIIYLPRKPNIDTQNFGLLQKFVKLGMTTSQADFSALCVYYLKQANHSMAHYLLSVFFSKLLRAQDDGCKAISSAAQEFYEICKITAAFFTMWGATLAGFPDEIYRQLFRDNSANISWKNGEKNQTPDFVKAHFQKALENKEVFSLVDKPTAKDTWVKKAINRLGYGKKAICKFCLFVASHDKSPDMTPGNEGLIIDGIPGLATYLTCEKWFSQDFEVIEHIANRDKPSPPYAYKAPDPKLYPGDYSIVDKIGNLTLWARSNNSSTYSEWPDKVYYYSTLTSLSRQSPVDLITLKNNLGIQKVPPSLANNAASSSYIANLAPIALRGQSGNFWDKDFVDQRTTNICELVFETLYEWIT